MRRNLPRFVKYLIGSSLVLMAISNCFNVLSNSSLRLASSTSDVSRSAAAAKLEPRRDSPTSSASDKLDGRESRFANSLMNSTDRHSTSPFKGLRDAGFPSPFAAALTATKTDNRPGVDPATANPGDTIMYTIEITNTGNADATNVMFTDTIDTNTTLVAGSVKVAPIAVDDAYNTIGNVHIQVPVAQ